MALEGVIGNVFEPFNVKFKDACDDVYEESCDVVFKEAFEGEMKALEFDVPIDEGFKGMSDDVMFECNDKESLSNPIGQSTFILDVCDSFNALKGLFVGEHAFSKERFKGTREGLPKPFPKGLLAR